MTKNAPIGDQISRQATIDKFNRFIEACKEEHTGGVVFTIDDAKYAFIKAVEEVETMSDLISREEEIARLEAELKEKQSEIQELNRKIGKLQIQHRLAEIEGRLAENEERKER